MSTEELLDQVALLPPEERSLVADSILRSLNPEEAQWEGEWLEEAQRRLQELRTGAVEAVPGNEVFNKVWQSYRK